MSMCVPVCPSQCVAAYMACAAEGRLEMEAACVLLDTLEPAVTKVGTDAGQGGVAGTQWPEQERPIGKRWGLSLSRTSTQSPISF